MHYTQNQVTDLVTPAGALREAAKYLQRHGWIQGSYYDWSATVFTPAACAVGALSMACYGYPCETPALNFDHPGFPVFEAALASLDWFLNEQWLAGTAYEFNDAKGRDMWEVIHQFNALADKLDANELCPAVSGGAA